MLEAAPRMDNIIEAMEPKVVGYHASHITPLYGNGYAKHYANICMEQLVLDRPLSLNNHLNLTGSTGSLAVSLPPFAQSLHLSAFS